jgi:hypothetical protein
MIGDLDITDYACHPLREPTPARFFLRKLLSTLRRERIKPRLAILLGLSPFRPNQAFLFEPVKRRVERALLDPQQVIRNPSNVGGDRVSMHPLARCQRLQDQQYECALENIVFP